MPVNCECEAEECFVPLKVCLPHVVIVYTGINHTGDCFCVSFKLKRCCVDSVARPTPRCVQSCCRSDAPVLRLGLSCRQIKHQDPLDLLNT